MRRILLEIVIPILGALMAALALLVALVLPGQERVTMLLCALFFGSCAAVTALIPRQSRQGRGRIAIRSLVHDGASSQAFVFPYSNGKQSVAFIGCLVFVVTGIGMMADPEGFGAPRLGLLSGRTIGTLNVLFFGMGALVQGLAIFAGKRCLALLPKGILQQELLGSWFVPWELVEAVSLFEMRGLKGTGMVFVGVRVTNVDSVPVSARARKLMRFNRARVGWHYPYAASHFAIPAAVVEHAIRYYFEHPQERERIGTVEGLAQLEGDLPRDTQR